MRNTPQASAPHWGALFHLQNAPDRDKKAPPRATRSTFCFYPLAVWLRCQLHTRKSTLCPMLPNHFILRASVGANEVSICPRESLPMASPTTVSGLWSLITNTQLTNSRAIFEGALFHLQNTAQPERKRASPFYFYRLFLPPITRRRCQLHPIHVLFT